MPEPHQKRRKVRKGTRNCWECKRRKVKCTFASATNETCDNCLRRSSACIGQEYEIESLGSTSNSVYNFSPAPSHRTESLPDDLSQGQNTSNPDIDAIVSTPGQSLHRETFPTPGSTIHTSIQSSAREYTGLAGDLVAIWPSQDDLDILYHLPVALATHLHMRPSTPSSAILSHEPPSPRIMLELPPPGSHPTLIARKLMVLGSLLQGALASSRIPHMHREKFESIMLNAVNTASRLVNSNDGLNVSIEGLECIMIETLIRNYAGELHRSWMCIQRAATVAHVLGLHREGPIPDNKFLDSTTRLGFDKEHLSFTIISLDRYLSLTLGLPCSSFALPAIASQAMAALQPIDRMARLQCSIAERILHLSSSNIVGAQEIDQLLLRAAAEMPPEWWLIPELKGNHQGGMEAFLQVGRINYQLAHYHLAIRLHLPCLLYPAVDVDSMQRKMTVVDASREILRRCIAFRTWHIDRFYCRGSDYIAFVALAVLSIAHIHDRSVMSSKQGFSHLAHSRLCDRAIMDQMLQIMKDIGDEISTKLGGIMQRLLDVELDVANGIAYHAVATESALNDGANECDGHGVDCGQSLQVHIPYFGSITLHRGMTSPPPHRNEIANEHVLTSWDSAQLSLDWEADRLYDFELSHDLTMQNVNGALFNSLVSDIDGQ